MSFPVDIPNPNQDNVYYSIASMESKMLEFFEKDRVTEILQILGEYYLPTYVFDTAGAPEVYNLDIYPTHGSKKSIQLDANGSLVDLQKISEPNISSPDTANINDGFFGATLDPSFHSSTKLKSPNTNEYPLAEVKDGLDLLLSTKWHPDPGISEKYQNFIILKNLLLAQLKTLPEEEMESIRNLYSDTLAKIDNFEEVLTQIEEGQENSISGLQYESIFADIYEKNTGSSPSNLFSSLEGTKTLVAQALSDLANTHTPSGMLFYRGSTGEEVGEMAIPETAYRVPSERIWVKFVSKLRASGLLDQEQQLDTPREGNISNSNFTDVQSLLKYEGIDVFSKDGKPKEWYYDNFQKVMLDQEPNWETLRAYIENVRETVEPYEKKAKLQALGGEGLLVDQAIMKAFLKLSMSNLDVTEFAPVDSEGNNFFAKIMRPGSLGPSGVTPWPSKYSVDPEDYQVKPYTNTAFLCYHALLTIIKSVEDTSSRQFLEDNIREPDSDHDKVIDLMIDVHSGTITGSTSGYSPKENSSTEKTKKSRDIQRLLHLYKQMEIFPISNQIFLIPEEDSVPISERSFVQWYLKRIRHTTEHAVKDFRNNAPQEGYHFLADDHASSVLQGSQDVGKLNLEDVPQAYANIGYLSPFVEGAMFQQRLLKVNYGIPKQNGTPDVLEFYKQRRYSMPYFWACMTSLWRAITSEVYKNMIDSVNEIMGTEINLSTEEIFEMMGSIVNIVWQRIRTLTDELVEENGIEFRIYASIDGTLNFVEKNAESGAQANSVRYRNTPGLNTKKMLQSYVKFVSMISDHGCSKIVDKHEPIVFDSSTYLPPEGLSNASNQNYANNHGGSSQYIESEFEPYFDKLQFVPLEFNSRLPIKKSTSPVGEDIEIINAKYGSFLTDNQRLFQHLQMFEYIIKAFEEIEIFVNSFSVNPGIKEVFISGDISLTKDLNDPATLKDQIKINRVKYEANEFGLGKRWIWKDWSPEKLEQTARKQGFGWLYVQVIGLEAKLWPPSKGTITIVPEIITEGEVIEIPEASHTFHFDDQGFLPQNVRKVQKRSQDFLKYLHLSAGLDISELTFSRDPSLEYSDLLVNSESGVFPWTKGDFEERVPKKKLETLFNMSPFLFPQNLFKDVCVPNKYQKVVACVITKKDLQGTGISIEEVEGSIDDIIGSLRWKLVE